MKRSLILLALLTSFFISLAQQAPPVIEWQKTIGGTYNDNGKSAVLTTDGGYVVAATSNSGDGDCPGGTGNAYQLWILKYNKDGVLQWQYAFGGRGDESNPVIKNTPRRRFYYCQYFQFPEPSHY